MDAQRHRAQPASPKRRRTAILGGFVGLFWVIQLVNAALGGALVAFGIHPRTLDGLVGILLAPFIHVSFAHLIANTIPSPRSAPS